MYFFNYFMDLEKSPENMMKDKWITTNLENIDSVLGMSPINNYSSLNETVKNTKRIGRKNQLTEGNVFSPLGDTDINKIKNEINRQIDMLAKGVKVNDYFKSYNNFIGGFDMYSYNMNTISKAIRKNKSTNLFTIDKSKLPASFSQSFETANGDTVNNLALLENVVKELNDTQVINTVIDEDAINMENGN